MSIVTMWFKNYYLCTMLKRILLWVTASLISLILMIYAVFPHHHHEGAPCFSQHACIQLFLDHHSCEHSEAEDFHDDSCCGHKHVETEPNSHTCELDNFVLIFNVVQGKTLHSTLLPSGFSKALYQAILWNLNFDFSMSEELASFRQLPYLIHYQSVFSGHTFGLRAPPVA